MKYVIIGDPILLCRTSFSRVWSEARQQKVFSKIDITRQHAGEPLFKGALVCNIIFFILPTFKQKNEYYHIGKPDLLDLMHVIKEIGPGILFPQECLIASYHALKLYDSTPRVEITLENLPKMTNTSEDY